MKTGKVSRAVLDRSVLRPLTGSGLQLADGVGFGGDSARFSCREADELACASVCGSLGDVLDRTLPMLLYSAAANLLMAGAEPEWMVMDLMIPSTHEEESIRTYMKEYAAFCRETHICPAGGHTEVMDAISRPVVSVTAYGKVDAQISAAMPEEDLVMAGSAGLAGTAILATAYREELERRYPFALIDTARGFMQQVSVEEPARAGLSFGVSAMHDVSQGGVFAALWELCDRAGTGLEVDLKRIPIRQETVEICEYFDLNPYQLYGQGAVLMGTAHGEALVMHLSSLGIEAAVIGRTTGGNDRIIRNGEEVRYLDKPAQDMLWKKADQRR